MVTRVTDLRKPIGQAITRLRLKLGLTQEQLASAADLYWTYILGIERGVRYVSIVYLFQIAMSLTLRVLDLVKEI